VRRALAEAVAAERLRIVSALIRVTGDWDLAEDAVSDAAERALLHWPHDGVPTNPAAWLTTTARRRAIDVLRRAGVERTKQEEAAMLDQRLGEAGGDDDGTGDDAGATPLTDDRLRLIFTCCHPALPLESQVALTLKVVSGLSTAAVARSFLTSEATTGQRLLRAKRKITNAGIPYRVPRPELLPDRLDGVLAVVYLLFTHAYAAPVDDARTGDAVTLEALRLGRLLVELMPGEDEAGGLLALMLLQHSRRNARVVDGELLTLEEQERTRWDRAAVDEALALASTKGAPRGPYRIQAALAAVHAVARDPSDTDWHAIAGLYDELSQVAPSPVVRLNRAIALGMRAGPLAGLEALDALTDDARLAGHHLVPAARADLLARAGARAEAVSALDEALELVPTEAERRQLARRRQELLAQVEVDASGRLGQRRRER
jgi:RNA polymerase sigma-70 factor (ECF subfamily)